MTGRPATRGSCFIRPKELDTDIASLVFMGHDPESDHDVINKVNRAFTTTTRRRRGDHRNGVPPSSGGAAYRPASFSSHISRNVSSSAGTQRAPTC